jgi:hypothetical protein
MTATGAIERAGLPLDVLSSPTPQFTGDEHRRIYDVTKDIPGWQMDGDAFKLYELGYHAGDVILELGVYGGRSAVVELRGALARPGRRQAPQFFGLDLDPEALVRSRKTLREFGLEAYALLYLGDVSAFAQEFTIDPTMVFVDADHEYAGVSSDLQALSRLLAPGVPVLCHDYTNPENDTGELGVRRAVTEWVEAGYARLLGVFGCSALVLTTDRCQGPQARMSDQAFAQRRDELLARYKLVEADETPDWQERARSLESELQKVYASRAWRLGSAIARVANATRRTLRF